MFCELGNLEPKLNIYPWHLRKVKDYLKEKKLALFLEHWLYGCGAGMLSVRAS